MTVSKKVGIVALVIAIVCGIGAMIIWENSNARKTKKPQRLGAWGFVLFLFIFNIALIHGYTKKYGSVSSLIAIGKDAIKKDKNTTDDTTARNSTQPTIQIINQRSSNSDNSDNADKPGKVASSDNPTDSSAAD